MSCRTASKFCCHTSRFINLTWTLRGAEHLEKDQSCVIVANHQSSLDVLGKLIDNANSNCGCLFASFSFLGMFGK